MVENGVNPEDLLGRKFGHPVNFWSMSDRKLAQRVDLGDQHQMVLLRPAHDPAKAWGFVGVVTNAEDLSASVWLWHKDGDQWAVDNLNCGTTESDDAKQRQTTCGYSDCVDDINNAIYHNDVVMVSGWVDSAIPALSSLL